MISTYSEQDIIYIIETGIRDYSIKYSNPKYKYPTVLMITGWLGNTVIADKKAETKIQDKISSIEDSYKGVDFSKFL